MGPRGATGAQGATGVVEGWVLYRELRFDLNRPELQSSEKAKLGEVARHLKTNPSLGVGIDASVNPGSEKLNQETHDQRVLAVRNNLIEAGVPAENIRTGEFRNAGGKRDGEVAIMIRTRQ